MSSGVLKSPDYTTELLIETLRILRDEYGFRGYIHAKAVPGTSPELIDRLGRLADRMSENLDLPSQRSLYQADWLMRFYKFDVSEIIDEDNPYLDPQLDPKANWAVNHLEHFPVEVNTAPLEMLLRVPGIGPRGARLIVKARRTCCLHEPELRKLGIAYKRARFFITCNGKYAGAGTPFTPGALRAQLAAPIDGGKHGRRAAKQCQGQLSLFNPLEGQGLCRKRTEGAHEREAQGTIAREYNALDASRGANAHGTSAHSAKTGVSNALEISNKADTSTASPRSLPEKSSLASQADGLFGWQHAIDKQKVCA